MYRTRARTETYKNKEPWSHDMDKIALRFCGSSHGKQEPLQ